VSSPTHHLYLHVPFCRLVCAYCDFVTVGGRGAEIPRYAEALLTELALRPVSGELATIYLGGGTPSLLAAPAVARLVQAARDRWETDPTEITLEANPSAREAPDWAGLRAAGVNRISLGIQSLRDAELWTLARVGRLIERRFGLKYSASQVWRILSAMHWSCQRPAGRARERNEQAIRQWKHKRWPALKKTPARRGVSSSSSTNRD